MWQKSSFSNPSGNCVESSQRPDGTVFLRDSKEKNVAIHLTYTQREWQDGAGVQFQPIGTIMDVTPVMRRMHLMQTVMSRSGDITQPWYTVQKDGTSLYFTQSEKDAWEKGVAAGKMTPAAA
jgi:Domain of unknown function (DUF397)